MAVPFELVENQVVVGIEIGGRGPFSALLDTAVAPSVVDLALARELGLRVRDDAPGEAAGQGSEGATFYPSELPDVRLGKLEIGDVGAVAADLSRLGSKLNQPLHAILGQSFFEGRVVQLDYPNRRIRLDPLGFERGVRADIEGAADLTPVVTVQVNGAGVPLVLDTGSSLTLGIYLESVEEVGLAESLAAATPRASIGARGHIDAHEGVVDSLALGDVRLGPVATVFLPRPHGDPTRALGNLGNGFLQHTVLTLDYPRRELYVAAATGYTATPRNRLLGSPGMNVSLRPLEDRDLDAIFRQVSDPESIRMAAFTAENQTDRRAFLERTSRLRADPSVSHRVIDVDGAVAGTIGFFRIDDQPEVTYWVDRAHWGKGIASAALQILLAEIAERPLYARAASDNVGSLRVLEKAGFRRVGVDRGFAAGRGEEIEETILRLD